MRTTGVLPLPVCGGVGPAMQLLVGLDDHGDIATELGVLKQQMIGIKLVFLELAHLGQKHLIG